MTEQRCVVVPCSKMGKKAAGCNAALARRMAGLVAADAMQALRQQTVAPATLDSYRAARRKIEAVLEELGGGAGKAPDLTKELFVKMVRAAELEGLGRSTPDTWRAAVRFFQRTEGWALGTNGEAWAEDEDLVHAMRGYRYQAKGRVRESGVLDIGVCNRICEYWAEHNPGEIWPLMLRVQFAIGARPSELAALTVGCRRWAQNGMRVHMDCVKNPKKAMEAVDTERAVLPLWEKYIDAAVKVAEARGEGPSGYLFCPKSQKVSKYAQKLKEAAIGLGLPKDMAWTPHGARHGKASELLESKVDDAWRETAKEMQMSPNVLQHYARTNSARMNGAAKARKARGENTAGKKGD